MGWHRISGKTEYWQEVDLGECCHSISDEGNNKHYWTPNMITVNLRTRNSWLSRGVTYREIFSNNGFMSTGNMVVLTDDGVEGNDIYGPHSFRQKAISYPLWLSEVE